MPLVNYTELHAYKFVKRVSLLLCSYHGKKKKKYGKNVREKNDLPKVMQLSNDNSEAGTHYAHT